MPELMDYGLLAYSDTEYDGVELMSSWSGLHDMERGGSALVRSQS
jgi:hypothetical protein